MSANEDMKVNGIDMLDIINTFEVARQFHTKLDDTSRSEYAKLRRLGLTILENRFPVDTAQQHSDQYLKLLNKAETRWMEENHEHTPVAKKKDGTWKYRTYLPKAYSSAKAVVNRALLLGVLSKDDIGKTEQEKLNKEAKASDVEGSRFDHQIELLRRYANDSKVAIGKLSSISPFTSDEKRMLDKLFDDLGLQYAEIRTALTSMAS